MAKISIVGRGIDPARHLSLSAIRILKAADKIVGIESEKEFWKELQKEFGTGKIEDLGSLYKSHDKDIINYQRYVNHVLTLASNFCHVVLLVAGHPLLGVSFIELLKKNAPENLEIEIVDGISSLDVMMTYLGLDPLEQGTAILDANRLLLFQYNLEPALSYFIYHVCSVGNSITNYSNPSLDNRIDLLRNYLLKFYPPEKKVFFCRISNGSKDKSTQIESTIGELPNVTLKIDYATTLYIPPEKPTQLDWNYLNLLRPPHEINV